MDGLENILEGEYEVRLRREQRQEAIEEVRAEEKVFPAFEPEAHVAEGGVPEFPAPIFAVGDRFSSLLGTGLKVEIVDHAEYDESKGWKCTVKVLAAGDNDHVKRGTQSFTFESTLVQNFEPLERSEKIVERKKRGEPKEEIDTPQIALPTSFSDAPWRNWPLPSLSGGVLQDFTVKASDENKLLLVRESTGEILGSVTPTAIGELGKRLGFPPDFVSKLSNVVAAAVINERIDQDKGNPHSVVFENGAWCNLVPSWRGILPTKQVAELVYQQLKSWYPDVEIVNAEHENGACQLRFLTPVVYPVTQIANDSLRLGIDITHQYGDTLRVSLFTRRISSGGGMLSFKSEYSWKKRSGDAGSANSQAQWLLDEVTRAVCGFTALIEKAKLMSETKLIGDSKKAFVQRARSMSIAKRYATALEKCFELEPGDTEWAWACAVSRFASGPDMEPELSRKIMSAIGGYVETFEKGQEFSWGTGVSEEDHD